MDELRQLRDEFIVDSTRSSYPYPVTIHLGDQYMFGCSSIVKIKIQQERNYVKLVELDSGIGADLTGHPVPDSGTPRLGRNSAE
jgi:hypothetical protein